MKAFYILPLLAGLAMACGETKHESSTQTDSTVTTTTETTRPAGSGQLSNFEWLEGTWEMPAPGGGKVTETWTRQDDSTMTAETAFFDSTGKKQPFETVELRCRAGVTEYVSTVAGQNDNKPVAFQVTSAGETGFTTENPKHDFPTKITYTRKGEDGVTATIEGTQNGKPAKEEYTFQKR